MGTNGSGRRKLTSWIDAFVDHTDNLFAPEVFRKWSAVSVIASVLEQKVWLTTSSRLYPNMYIFLLGHPGTGKSRTIQKAREFLHEVPEFYFAPNSLTFAACLDALVRCKRVLIRHPPPALEYNTMLIAADELGTLMHKWDKEMADGLSAFYDPYPYGQDRRGGDIKIKIKSPQINMLCGSTPSNLVETLPEGAWGQGFTSRVVMVFSDERLIGDDFAMVTKSLPPDMLTDLRSINALNGEFKVTTEFREAVNAWRANGEQPSPSHPKLLHYNTRRRVNLYKLSMIAAIDKGDVLLLTKADFERALAWLHEVEVYMEDIFKAAGGAGSDSQAMDEIAHFVMINDKGQGVTANRVIDFARERVPAHSVLRVIEVMCKSDMITECILQKGPRAGDTVYTSPKRVG